MLYWKHLAAIECAGMISASNLAAALPLPGLALGSHLLRAHFCPGKNGNFPTASQLRNGGEMWGAGSALFALLSRGGSARGACPPTVRGVTSGPKYDPLLLRSSSSASPPPLLCSPPPRHPAPPPSICLSYFWSKEQEKAGGRVKLKTDKLKLVQKTTMLHMLF